MTTDNDPSEQTPADDVQVVALDDPALAPYRGLYGRAATPVDPGGRARFIAESEHVVRRLLASTWPIESVVGTRSRLLRLRSQLPPATPTYALERAALDELLGFRLHRAVLACAPRPAARFEGPPLDWSALAQRPRALVVIAQGLANPANLGSILRSARALGVDHLLLDRRGADPLERRAIRGSMGHCFAQPWTVTGALAEELVAAARTGFRVLVATAEARAGHQPLPIDRLETPRHTALIVGNEGHGVAPAIARLAHAAVMIPMANEVDSLGVAVATALMMHALTRPLHETAALRETNECSDSRSAP
jgi:tRNA G18 (ribose-2'-O)-methylase SpoU